MITDSNSHQQMSALHGIFSGEMPYCVMDIRRSYILQDTLSFISTLSHQNNFHILKKPLKVTFSGEDAVDEGGVTKEYFQLLISHLFAESTSIFVPTADHRSLWLNKDRLFCDDEYYLIGILLGLGIYNDVLLDIRFPKVLYKKLLKKPIILDDLIHVDQELYKGLCQLLSYPNKDEIEYVFCRNFTVEWDYFDEKRVIELKPGGT
jgi:hypothetical protein